MENWQNGQDESTVSVLQQFECIWEPIGVSWCALECFGEPQCVNWGVQENPMVLENVKVWAGRHAGIWVSKLKCTKEPECTLKYGGKILDYLSIQTVLHWRARGCKLGSIRQPKSAKRNVQENLSEWARMSWKTWLWKLKYIRKSECAYRTVLENLSV